MSRTLGSGGLRAPLTDRQRKTLIAARKSADLNQTQLAEQIDCTQAQVARVECGSGDPSEALLTRWCTALGLACQVEIRVTIRKS
jgi:transcriptional regulator with XRE-family HTH domain